MNTLSQTWSGRPRSKDFLFQCFLLILILNTLTGYAQSDLERIVTLRKASNDALRAFDYTQFFSYLTDDIQITTGNGTLIQGKSGLRSYLEEAVGNKVYFVRTITEVEVNTERGLAWETGTWKRYDLNKENKAIAGGKYAAQWAKTSKGWRIKSELFVTLE